MKPTLLIALLSAQLAVAQTVIPWLDETPLIPSGQAADPTFFDSDAGPRLLGTDPLMVGGYAYSRTTVNQVLAVGPVLSASSVGDFTVLASSSGSLLSFIHLGGVLGQALPLATPVPGLRNVAMARDPGGQLQVWAGHNAQLTHFMLDVVDGGFTYTSDRTLTLPQQSSGLAFDRRAQRVFVSQPTLGILVLGPASTLTFAASIDAGHLGAVVGGLDVLALPDGGTWVLSANASTDSIAIHELDTQQDSLTFIGSFQMGPPDGGLSRLRSPSFVTLTQRPSVDSALGLLAAADGFAANYKVISLATLDTFFRFSRDGGAMADAGADGGADGGLNDGGSNDGGSNDGGSSDGGADGGLDGGQRPGGPGGPGSPFGSDPDPVPTCGCATSDLFVMLPALLLLWWIRRPSRATPL